MDNNDNGGVSDVDALEQKKTIYSLRRRRSVMPSTWKIS